MLYKEGSPLVIEQVEIAPPGPEQVRIRMVSAGICASDGHFVWGQQLLAEVGQSAPCIPGHEGAGIVESVGANVTSLKVGDHVLATFAPACGECNYCLSECDTNLCMKGPLMDPTFGAKPKLLKDDTITVSAMGSLGVYSEYVLLHHLQALPIAAELNLENACIISCAVCTGFYAAVNQAKVKPNSTAAVWGLGAIGLNAVFGCKHSGAKHIIGIDINNEKKSVGEEFGVTEFVNPLELNQPVEKYLTEKYGGVDFALDCIGNQSVLHTALHSLSPYGTLAVVGVSTTGTEMKFPPIHLLTGRKIVGGLMGNKPAKDAFKELTQMYGNGEYNVDRLVTHRFPLEQINDAFQLLKDGKCIRSLILFDKK